MERRYNLPRGGAYTHAIDTEIELEVLQPGENGGTANSTGSSAAHNDSFKEGATPATPTQMSIPRFIRDSLILSDKGQAKSWLETEASDLVRTAFWMALGCSIGVLIWIWEGRDAAMEYWTCYIVEQSLSIDNLFVFMLIFSYFKVPRESQEQVLYWGIVGACCFRGIMIVIGEALVQRFDWITIFFAAILLYSAYKVYMEGDDDDEDAAEAMGNNRIVQFARSIIPVADKYHGKRFIVRENGKLLGTPLFVVLVCIELSDVVFAMDSVPAVLGISSRTLVVYMSNIAAVLGLRSLYFVISDAIANLRFLKHSLSIMLAFVGMKILVHFVGIDIGVGLSLGIVVTVLAVGVTASLLFPAKLDKEHETEQETPRV
mmetsp:Transcript_15382/g.26936  ORF Transcript_15382/g.26936 Transcript_15382/m.26936 type:complete len:374 (-) Transcript_15382:390-1511(-)